MSAHCFIRELLVDAREAVTHAAALLEQYVGPGRGELTRKTTRAAVDEAGRCLRAALYCSAECVLESSQWSRDGFERLHREMYGLTFAFNCASEQIEFTRFRRDRRRIGTRAALAQTMKRLERVERIAKAAVGTHDGLPSERPREPGARAISSAAYA